MAIWTAKQGEAGAEASFKIGNAIKAQKLRDYSVELITDDLDDSPGAVAKVTRALEALATAYELHRLPVSLFAIAAIYDGIDENEAQRRYRLFLKAQAEFIPDAADTFWLDTFGYDMPQMIERAEAKTNTLRGIAR